MARKPRKEEEWEPEEVGLPETSLRSSALLDEILTLVPPDDPRRRYLLLLRHQIQVDEKQFQEAQKAIQQLNEAYEKLTAPANRIGTYLGSPGAGLATIAVGDAEYHANVDPHLDVSQLKVGTRVRVNEAFAVVGDLGCSVSGPICKVMEVLGEDRLRVTLDSAGVQGRIVLRSTDLRETKLKVGDEVRLEPNFRVALEHFPKAEVKDYYFEQVPEISWDQVGGQ